VPVKDTTRAKQRLADVLTAEQRRLLALPWSRTVADVGAVRELAASWW